MSSVSGTWHWVVTTSGTSPTPQQIKAGRTHTGATAPASGNRIIRTSGGHGAAVLGLAPGTTYWAHSVIESSGGGFTDVLTSGSFATADMLIALSDNVVQAAAEVGTLVGTAFIASDFAGTPSWSLTSNAGGKYAINTGAGDVTVAAALTQGVDQITVAVSGVTPAPNPRSFDIIVFDDATIALHSIWAGDVQ